MTKKHFTMFAEKIAADLAETRIRFPHQYAEMWRAASYAAETFATVARASNPNFDRERFRTACGITSEAFNASVR